MKFSAAFFVLREVAVLRSRAGGVLIGHSTFYGLFAINFYLFCSAGLLSLDAPLSTDYKQYFFFCAPRAGVLFPNELEKVFASENAGKGSPRGGLSLASSAQDLLAQTCSPYGSTPPAPTGCEGRGGKDKMQRNLEVLQKRIWILKMGTAAITGVYARGLFFEKRLDTTRAGRETEESVCKTGSIVSDIKNFRNQHFPQDVPMPAGTVRTIFIRLSRASDTELLSPSFACPHPRRTPFSPANFKITKPHKLMNFCKSPKYCPASDEAMNPRETPHAPPP